MFLFRLVSAYTAPPAREQDDGIFNGMAVVLHVGKYELVQNGKFSHVREYPQSRRPGRLTVASFEGENHCRTCPNGLSSATPYSVKPHKALRCPIRVIFRFQQKRPSYAFRHIFH